MIVEFEGQRHEFPDGTSQEDIAAALEPHAGAPKSYWDNLKQTFIESVERTTRGGRQLAQGAREWRDDLADAKARSAAGQPQQEGLPRHDPGEGYGAAPLDVVAGATNLVLGPLGAVTSPINAAIDQYIGGPVESVTGIPRGVTDFAAGFALPLPKRIPVPAARLAEGAAPERALVEGATGPQPGVILSEGQRTGDLSTIQREQAATRGNAGPGAQRNAQAFQDQQAQQLAEARERLARSMDPAGARVVENPQEAGALVQQSLQKTAAARKADVDAAYSTARAMPGEVAADAFTGMSRRIKSELSAGDEPVVIDDALTPHASRMIRDIDERVSQLKIQNRAQPQSTSMMPAGEQAEISGITLKGVDQMRKRLSSFRSDAMSSGNGADYRAARAVLDRFDAAIDAAINGGQFRGDPRAINAWNAAREAHTDFRKTFGSAGRNKDRVAGVVQKVLGNRDNPAAIPNDVADFMFGSAGVNPASLNVAVVNRIKNIMGDRSPEWSAVKQGLFSRLVEVAEGVKPMGPGTVATRLHRFLNSDGKEMAGLVFSADERAMLQQYANLMRQIEVPQAGANWSNTATFAAQGYKPSMASRALSAIGSNVGAGIMALLGHFVLPGGGLMGEIAGGAAAKIAGASGQAREARQIAKQMPVIGNAVREFKLSARAAETTPNARNIARLTLASRNLSNNLQSIGVAMSPDDILRSMQGAVPASAGEKKQQP